MTTGGGPGEIFAILLFYAAIGAAYFVPTIVAFRRLHPNRWLILAVNAALGGTGIGWIGCLVWALRRAHLPADPTQSRGGQSGLNLFVNDARTVHLAEAPPASRWGTGRDTAWAVGQLDGLNRLRDAGHLTPEEYARLKAEVLAAVA